MTISAFCIPWAISVSLHIFLNGIWDGRVHGLLTRYAKLRGAQAPGMPGTFFPGSDFKGKSLVSDPGMHHGMCVTHVPWCMSGSLTCSGGENVPCIPGACASHNSTYLVRGPYRRTSLLSPTVVWVIIKDDPINLYCRSTKLQCVIIYVCVLSTRKLQY